MKYSQEGYHKSDILIFVQRNVSDGHLRELRKLWISKLGQPCKEFNFGSILYDDIILVPLLKN